MAAAVAVVGGAEVAGGPDISDSRCYERGGIERIVEEEGAAAAALQYRGYCSRVGGCEGERWRLGLGRWERRPRGFAHGRQERRDFLLISCVD